MAGAIAVSVKPERPALARTVRIQASNAAQPNAGACARARCTERLAAHQRVDDRRLRARAVHGLHEACPPGAAERVGQCGSHPAHHPVECVAPGWGALRIVTLDRARHRQHECVQRERSSVRARAHDIAPSRAQTPAAIGGRSPTSSRRKT
jgi:hypothetical protein